MTHLISRRNNLTLTYLPYPIYHIHYLLQQSSLNTPLLQHSPGTQNTDERTKKRTIAVSKIKKIFKKIYQKLSGPISYY